MLPGGVALGAEGAALSRSKALISPLGAPSRGVSHLFAESNHQDGTGEYEGVSGRHDGGFLAGSVENFK